MSEPVSIPAVDEKAVAAFFSTKLAELQARLPRYASITLEVSRHTDPCTRFDSFIFEWTGYVDGHDRFPSIHDDKSSLARVFEHADRIAEKLPEKEVAADLRSQAAALIERAEELERSGS